MIRRVLLAGIVAVVGGANAVVAQLVLLDALICVTPDRSLAVSASVTASLFVGLFTPVIVTVPVLDQMPFDARTPMITVTGAS